MIIPAPAAYSSIQSSVSATADSGGNVAGQGGKVITGDSHASVQVTTAGSSSGTVVVDIKTSTNGIVHQETATTTSPAYVSLQATPRKATIDVAEGTPPVTVRHEVFAPASSSEIGTTTAAAAIQPAGLQKEPVIGLGATIILAVRDFFASLLGWFR